LNAKAQSLTPMYAKESKNNYRSTSIAHGEVVACVGWVEFPLTMRRRAASALGVEQRNISRSRQFCVVEIERKREQIDGDGVERKEDSKKILRFLLSKTASTPGSLQIQLMLPSVDAAVKARPVRVRELRCHGARGPAIAFSSTGIAGPARDCPRTSQASKEVSPRTLFQRLLPHEMEKACGTPVLIHKGMRRTFDEELTAHGRRIAPNEARGR